MPLLGDIPILDVIFSQRAVGRDETELVTLVSPEFVHPLEAEETPLILPGMEVTEPGDWDFFLFGRYEGNPFCHHRSTVWPIYRDHVIRARHQSIIDAKQQMGYQESESYYVFGEHGFSE